MGSSNVTRSPKASRAKAGAPTAGLAEMSLACPVCEAKFLADYPVDIRLEGRESDLRPVAHAALDPLLALTPLCPRCHFAAAPQAFGFHGDALDELHALFEQPPCAWTHSRAEPWSPEEFLDLRHFLRRGWPLGPEPGGAQRFIQKARCREHLRDDAPLAVVDDLLHASWCARGEGEAQLESDCQREVVARLSALLQEDAIAPVDQMHAMFLVGELSRRTGDFVCAVDQFSQIEFLADEALDAPSPEATFFVRQARRLMPLATIRSAVSARLEDDMRDLDDD